MSGQPAICSIHSLVRVGLRLNSRPYYIYKYRYTCAFFKKSK